MDTYTIADWQRDKELSPEVGQFIADDVMEELINCVPPRTYLDGIFQPCEAYDHVNGRSVYQTFKHTESGWQYCGLKPGYHPQTNRR